MPLNDFYKFIENKSIQDYIVKLRYKYFYETGWHYRNEILEWNPDLEVYEWCNDWDEYYDKVEVLGYIAVTNADVPDNLKEE